MITPDNPPSPTETPQRARRPRPPPPIPAVAMQLLQQMQDPRVTAGDISRLIGLDPSLTISLLRLVNSPFFGMCRQVASVSDAVMVMGMGAVRRVVLSLAVTDSLRGANIDTHFAREQWRHYVSCAALARQLIDDNAAAAELAFTAGLLHDMGQVHLLQLHGDAYVQLHASAAAAGIDVRVLEIKHFGHAHDTLGAELLESWGLPQAIADAARKHDATPPLTGLTREQQAVWAAHRLTLAPDDAEQVIALCPDRLAPPEQAIELARAEIETLMNLLST